MAKKKKKNIKQNKKNAEGFSTLAKSFHEASRITFSLVFFPIIILLGGVWLDKKLATTPLFILVGIVAGVIGGILKATRIKKEYPQKGGKKNG